MEKGRTTSEFWLTLLTGVLGVLKASWLPDIPEEAFYTVIAYVGGRSLRKGLKK